MLLEFKYKLPMNILELMNTVFYNFSNDSIIGWLNQPDASMLKKCSLYLVCDAKMDNSNKMKFDNPVGIVAKNESTALEYYGLVFDKQGYIHSELVQDCSKLKVEPTGEFKDILV